MRRKQKGGLPSMYFSAIAKEPSASPGGDSFNGIPRSGIPVANYKGGSSILGCSCRKRKSRIRRKGTRRKGTRRKGTRRKGTRRKGGFTPSVMGGLVSAVSKYLVPIAMFSGYKLITKKKRRV